ncbi:LLM class F420-dependent oxidoreductase [Herbiconiux sp. L3-i23]|uniref:LLM class F420-dependent oxidoreductase n=1 Tax=Herbiconiux sp. L3-i23 TaxID=2905871 RepID=UPI0020521D47|nr:LLM class F420-dependent oxidoreductase [Herbiconiux sp. L3-i23]BDI23691.1 LLM class F420-dependent oxidoreductase [Herbiconiux sp. L3-i23]
MTDSTAALSSTWTDRLGRVGVWRSTPEITPALAASIEQLGYGTLWLGGSPASDLRAAEEFLDATESLQVATGIVNIWKSDPDELARSFHRIEAKHPGRLVLGIGTGHREASPERVRPIDAMNRYLDVLDREGVPAGARVLSALGPRMLEVASERSAGTHPYLTVPQQTREARDVLGEDALVAPEQTVVFGEDTAEARISARAFLKNYLRLDNYTRNMRRAGFTDADIVDGGSDELVDALVVHGDAATIAASVEAHLAAGADHVCVQVQPSREDILGGLSALADRLGLRPTA